MNFRIALLLWLLDYCSAQDANCDFNIKVTVGKTYYLKSPNYPENYAPGVDCRWIGVCPSGYQCHLVCQDMFLPMTLLGNMDRLLVSRTGDPQLIGATYYDVETLPDIMSIGQSISIGLKTSQYSTGGRLSCQLTAQAAPSALSALSAVPALSALSALPAISALSALSAPVSSMSCSCGWRKQNRIVNQNAGDDKYPFGAGLVTAKECDQFCGATVISDRYVLTAATCVVKRQLEGLAVIVGEHDVTTEQETSASKLYRVSNTFIHPQFNECNNDYNIAIVTVAEPIQFSDRVGPVCLPFKYQNTDFAGRKVTALGWGSKSKVLMEVKLDVLDQSSCRAQVPSVTDQQICTFTPGKGFCQEDIGGPLLYTDPLTGLLFIVGIISDYNDGATNFPGVNTRVSVFADWIVQTTQASYCVK